MVKKRNYKLIFEGVELAGKSFTIHGVFDFLEKKYNTHPKILNGCHWFNCDVGIFGTDFGKLVIDKYLQIAEIMKEKNIIFEKLHISDQVYHSLYERSSGGDYKEIEDRLTALNTKIVFCTVKPDKEIFKKRLNDRLKLYPHYGRIIQTPEDYLKQQEKFFEFIEKTKLPVLNVDLTQIPNSSAVDEILDWIGERA